MNLTELRRGAWEYVSDDSRVLSRGDIETAVEDALTDPRVAVRYGSHEGYPMPERVATLIAWAISADHGVFLPEPMFYGAIRAVEDTCDGLPGAEQAVDEIAAMLRGRGVEVDAEPGPRRLYPAIDDEPSDTGQVYADGAGTLWTRRPGGRWIEHMFTPGNNKPTTWKRMGRRDDYGPMWLQPAAPEQRIAAAWVSWDQLDHEDRVRAVWLRWRADLRGGLLELIRSGRGNLNWAHPTLRTPLGLRRNASGLAAAAREWERTQDLAELHLAIHRVDMMPDYTADQPGGN